MDIYSLPPVAVILDGAYGVVTTLALWLAPLFGSLSAASAIALITILVRCALIPVGRAQVHAEFARARLAPRLREIQKRFSKNPELLRRKTMELYAQEKVSPTAGCLPTLAQAPVLSTVYGLFILTTVAGHPNLLLAEHVAGIPLGTSLMSLLATGAVWPGVLVFGALLLVIGTTAWFSRTVALKFAQSQRIAGAPAAEGAGATMERLSGALSWLPFTTLVFATVVPLAATIYLTVTTAWTLVERIILRRILAER